MHELVTKESPSLSPASPTAARLRGVACDTVLSYLDEAVDDLSELRFLIDDLSQTPVPESVSAVDLCGLDWLHTNFKRSIQLIAARQKRQLDLIEKAKRWATAAQLAALLDEARSEYIALKSSLRVAYRHRGIMLCASDWQSPSYSSSIEINANRLSAGIAEHVLDYKRDGHLDAQAYEQAFIEQYVQHLGSDQVQAYLANSGMGAFSTVLHWLAHEACLTESVLAVQPMYFENLHLSRGFFPDMQQIQAPTRQELLHRLNSQMPSIVLCDAVTNCGDMIAHEIECILTWAATKTVERTAIVIDTTCVPLALLPAGLLQELPEHVSVIFVESLAKHHQFGMDTVTGGIVVAHMSKDNQNSFAKSRARLGNNISDGSVGSLPQPDRQKLIRRMQRHSRNVAAIARACEQMSSEQAGVLQSVSWVREGSAGAPWFHGSCLTLQLRKGYRSIEAYRQFEQTVLEFAKECGHPIAFGTSFGFDVSRLYVTAPSTRFEEPFLRISIGTETTAELLAFIEILRRTNVDVRHDEDFSPPRIAPTKEANEPALEAQPSVNAPLKQVSTDEKPNIASTVYLGEAGLQNYLNPANYPATPLIELPDDLNPFRQDGVRLLAKMVPLVPLMNIKSLPAFSMLSKAFERGDLAGVTKVIESSSSNTVLSLSVMAKMFGIDTTCAIVDHSIAPSLMRMLRLFGIEIFQHPAAGHELFGVLPPRSDRAATMGSQPGWTNPGQYTNPDN
ncbi:MAG TPA: pyridoxal-phosphate dependent enzyme, partial [Trichormus sp.]